MLRLFQGLPGSFLLLSFCLVVILQITNCSSSSLIISEQDHAENTPNQAIRVSYGDGNLQFADLRLPDGEGPFPIIMIIHGGCWRSQFKLTLMDSMAIDLSRQGYATWNIEYRRTEDIGGGWPGTFTDVANALKHIEILAKDYPVDVERIVVTGHSAGGHLALWLGAQNQLEKDSQLKVDGLPSIRGIVSLAGITDLVTYYVPSGCGSNVANLIGGLPENFPERYTEGSPISFIPLGIPLRLVNGEEDNIVPLTHIMPFFNIAKTNGENIELITVPSAGHFDVITPGSIAWSAIVDAFINLIGE